MKRLLVFLLITLTSHLLLAQDSEQQLRSLVDEFLEKVDSKEMHDRFWAEDLIYTSSSGTRFGKSQIMLGFDEESTTEEAGPRYSAEEVQVKLLSEEVAVVAFKLVSIDPTGERTEYWNSGTFQKRQDDWKVVNWQATKIPDGE
jgi:hypothetical protein